LCGQQYDPSTPMLLCRPATVLARYHTELYVTELSY